MIDDRYSTYNYEHNDEIYHEMKVTWDASSIIFKIFGDIS
jgi:hypothetical protein